ncbi:hypothetical protein [Calderihabitans maritimus]|uniref:UmuC domain-containing protein n=1 Tax=Calderihabitans maritimus TaxID=1246530 RepID=A0A1Z5HWJ4_9FIRM|nr:hypothetical protein [Calderihabitans maritimus]GAW93884.1 hypothetical protein STH1888 [Calderihabitans maritimus]
MAWIAYLLLSSPQDNSGTYQKLLNLGSYLSPKVEPLPEELSLFIDLGNEPGQFLKELHCELNNDLQFTAFLTGGIARNKFLAKAAALFLLKEPGMAAGRKIKLIKSKKYHLLLIPEGEERSFSARLPVDFLWPVEASVLNTLKLMGLATLGEVAQIPERQLVSCWGSTGYRLYLLSRGIDFTPLRASYPPLRYLYRTELGKAMDRRTIEKALTQAANHLSQTLKKQFLGCHCLKLYLYLEEGPVSTGIRKFATPSSQAVHLKENLFHLLRLSRINSPVYRIVVAVEELAPLQWRQLKLFEETKPPTNITQSRKTISPWLKKLQQTHGSPILNYGCQADRREKILCFWDPLHHRLPGVSTLEQVD